MERFREVIQNRHSYAQKWKEKNGRGVVGYLCSYVPEEIIYAAGLLPVRVVGSHKLQTISDSYIYNMFCPYCRYCLAEGLEGRYNYLDGIVHAFSCLHIRQTYDSWVKHVPTPFHHFIYVPDNLQQPVAQSEIMSQFKSFKSALENHFSISINEEALQRAIGIYDANRSLLRRLYELRKGDAPPISGAEVMEVVLAGMYMDKAEHNLLLQELLKEREGKKGKPIKTRLMYISSESDDVGVIQLIENLGAGIVIDDNCIGTRYFWGEVDSACDPLFALATRYMKKKPLCPTKDVVGRARLPHIRRFIEEYRVNGVIFGKLKFCSPHEYDIPGIMKMLVEMGIPCLTLDIDVLIPEGQFRTRVEAFLEILCSDEIWV